MDKDRIVKLAEEGMLEKSNVKRAMFIYYCVLLQNGCTERESVLDTCNKFGVSHNTVRRAVKDRGK